VARAAREAERRLGRPATEVELAGALGVSLAAYRRLLDEVAPVALVGLDALEEWRGDGDGHDPLDALLARERVELLADAVRRLPEREQLVLSLYYRDELAMKEVGAVLGVTESRVSQLHTQALLRVRALLQVPGVGAARGALKVRRQPTDERSGGAWERPGNEMPHGKRAGAGGSSGFGNVSEVAATSSTRMRPLGHCSKRSDAHGRTEITDAPTSPTADLAQLPPRAPVARGGSARVVRASGSRA